MGNVFFSGNGKWVNCSGNRKWVICSVNGKWVICNRTVNLLVLIMYDIILLVLFPTPA